MELCQDATYPIAVISTNLTSMWNFNLLSLILNLCMRKKQQLSTASTIVRFVHASVRLLSPDALMEAKGRSEQAD